MSFEAIELDIDGAIASLRLNRPRARNALDLGMRRELGEAVAAIQADDGLRVLILSGAGECFCSGGDLKALAERERPPSESRGRVKVVHRWLHELVNLELPVIAAVDGPAYGAGFSLALAADFVLATPRARFCAVFGRIGLVPDLGMFYLLPRRIGLQAAKDLIFSARALSAAEAQQLGLVYSLHEPDQLLPAARRLAARFVEGSPQALGLAKNILNQSMHLDWQALEDLECHAQALCIATDYHRSAVRRVLDKQALAFDWERLDDAEGPA